VMERSCAVARGKDINNRGWDRVFVLDILLWLGWASLAKKVYPPSRGGVNSDPLYFFVLALSKSTMFQVISKCPR
jgi:hypothetical protein